jgi:hypothetical protein
MELKQAETRSWKPDVAPATSGFAIMLDGSFPPNLEELFGLAQCRDVGGFRVTVRMAKRAVHMGHGKQ